jgi:hypothetical protein
MITVGILGLLHADHETVDELMAQIEATEAGAEEREELFMRFKEEMMVHKVAEERVFYAKLLQHPEAREKGKHCNEEHSEVVEMIHKLEQLDSSSPRWLQTFTKLKSSIHHHVDEEENNVASLARRILGDDQLEQLGQAFLLEKQRVQARLHGEDMADEVEIEGSDLEEQSREALYQLAQQHDIAGRSHMNKEELVGALRYGAP